MYTSNLFWQTIKYLSNPQCIPPGSSKLLLSWSGVGASWVEGSNGFMPGTQVTVQSSSAMYSCITYKWKLQVLSYMVYIVVMLPPSNATEDKKWLISHRWTEDLILPSVYNCQAQQNKPCTETIPIQQFLMLY